jgi:hypothetical protein
LTPEVWPSETARFGSKRVPVRRSLGEGGCACALELDNVDTAFNYQDAGEASTNHEQDATVTRPRNRAAPSRQNSDLFSKFKLIWVVQSLRKKYFASPQTQITSISIAVSSHMRGASRSSRTRGGMRWTRQRRRARQAQGGLISVSVAVFTQDDGAVSTFVRLRRDTSCRCSGGGGSPRTEKSCGPDASTLASSLAEARSAQPGRTKPFNPRGDGDKKARSPGRSRIIRQAIACGNAG